MCHEDILRGVQAVKPGELQAGADAEVEFFILDTVVQADPVGIGRELIGIAEEAVEFREGMGGLFEVIGIIDTGVLIIGIIIVQLQDLVLPDGLRIRKGGAEIEGMKRIVIPLIDGIDYSVAKGVQCIIIAIAVIHIRRRIQIEGHGPERLFKPMPELKIGVVDIEAGIVAGRMTERTIDQGPVIIGSDGAGGAIGRGRLKAYPRPEDQRVAAVEPMFQVKIDPVIFRPLEAQRTLVDQVYAVRIRLVANIALGMAVLLGSDMLLIVKITAVSVCIGAPGIPVIGAAGPDGRDPAAALTRAATKAATATASASSLSAA